MKKTVITDTGITGVEIEFTLQETIIIKDLLGRLSRNIENTFNAPGMSFKTSKNKINRDIDWDAVRATCVLLEKISGDVQGMEDTFNSLFDYTPTTGNYGTYGTNNPNHQDH